MLNPTATVRDTRSCDILMVTGVWAHSISKGYTGVYYTKLSSTRKTVVRKNSSHEATERGNVHELQQKE